MVSTHKVLGNQSVDALFVVILKTRLNKQLKCLIFLTNYKRELPFVR